MLEIFLDAELKNKVVDLLLENDVNDFYCFEGYRYASKELLLSEKEKVSGKKEYVLFKILLNEKEAKKISKIIKAQIDSNRIQII